MSTIIASNIPHSTSEAKIREFFSFCGKIKDLSVVEDDEKKGKSVKVEFEKASAISTALLLNGAEFDGSQLEVKESGESSGSTAPSSSKDGEEEDGDIEQEEKPKSAIIAELLANGYVLQSSLVEKAIEFDKEKGISERFHNFIQGLDQKYHLQEKNKQVADQTTKLTDQANNQWGIQERWNQGVRTLNSYLDKFKQDKYGSQVHDFYTNVAKDVKSVNDEALRLAELKKQHGEGSTGATSAGSEGTADQSQPPTYENSEKATTGKVGAGTAVFPTINSITPDSTTAQSASAVPLEKK